MGLVKIRTCMGVKFTRGVKVKAYINLIDVARSVDLQARPMLSTDLDVRRCGCPVVCAVRFVL